MDQQKIKTLELCHKFYSQSAKIIWVGIVMAFIGGVGSFYTGFQLDQASAAVETEVYQGRAVSGRDEPRDTVTDARFSARNDQIGELMGGGAFAVFMSLMGMGAMLWLRVQSRRFIVLGGHEDSAIKSKAA